MKKAFLLSALALTVLWAGTAQADLFHSPKFKSPAGRYEVIFASAGASVVPFIRTEAHVPTGQKPQYMLLFYVVGGADPVSADWYTDVDPAPSAEQIAASLLWSPNEQNVVVTHGQTAKAAGANRWLVSLTSPSAYGFEGNNLRWIDNNRLVADLQTPKVPGGIELLNASKGRGELIVSPHAGLGYKIAASTGTHVIVENYLNHWGDERDKTSWELFTPACFDLDLNTLKKRSVVCPK